MSELPKNKMEKSYSLRDAINDEKAGRDIPPEAKEALDHINAQIRLFSETFDPMIKSFGRELQKNLRPLAQSTREIARRYADLCDKPEYILTMALADREDSHALREAVKTLLGRIAREDAVITNGGGEPPRVAILGKTIGYQEILELENLAPALRTRFDTTVIGHLTLAEIYTDLISTVVKDAKARVVKSERDEIKRRGSRLREAELPENSGYDTDFSSIPLLEDIRTAAVAEGYRADRIQNTLKVAWYGMNHGTLAGAAELLNIHRDTIHERRKDLRHLLKERE
jgi:hypothetical protein